MKINLTKSLLEDIRVARKVLNKQAKVLTGDEKKEAVKASRGLTEVLNRHEARTEKDY